MQFPELRPGMSGGQVAYPQQGVDMGAHRPPPGVAAYHPGAVPYAAGHPGEPRPQYMAAPQPGVQYGAMPMYPMVGAGGMPPGVAPQYQASPSIACCLGVSVAWQDKLMCFGLMSAAFRAVLSAHDIARCMVQQAA